MQNPYQEFHSRAGGLIGGMISSNREEFGSNELEVKKSESWWKKLLRQFTDLLVVVLIVAGLLSLFLGEKSDALVILGIVMINALIGFIQEFKTERMLEALQKLVAPSAKVLRNGKVQVISANEVVVGDILILEEGMKVAGDAILLEANELKVSEAILTGESLAVLKTLSAKKREESMVFASTEIVNGSGKAIVSAVGGKTEFGKIAKLTTSTQKSESPLTREMKHIGVFVGKVSLVISFFLFLLGYFFQNYSFIESLLFAVAVAVAAVPEGLPVTITTALALGMRRLADKKALVKELKSVETLGATTVICSDKTGTLTRNEMVVKRGFLLQHGEFEVTGVGYNPQSGEVGIVRKNLDAQKLFTIADACNDAELRKKGKLWRIIGDPTEGALRVVARKFGIKVKWKRRQSFPFDSNRKRMSVVVGAEILAKGAPEKLLTKCSRYLENGKVRKLDAKTRKRILSHAEFFAHDALRVLGCAYRQAKKSEKLNPEKAEKDLIFVGLLGMYDAPRKEVKKAVKLCSEAGIRINIITGDFGITAKAIAKELGIADEKTKVIEGEELKKMSDQALKKILKKKTNLIFARVKPADKLRIVDAYKSLKEIVAVTGDGVNDAPALKSADIGVVMGRCGADVAKEAASLILADDSFASIVDAVAEGRRIYNNMKKFIIYIFSCNIGELLVVFSAIVLMIPTPLTAVLILLVDLGTDLFPSLALGIDPPEKAAMHTPPRNPKQHIMNREFTFHFVALGLVIGALVVGGYFWDLHRGGWSFGETLSHDSILHLHAASFAFATLVIIQLFNVFNFRSPTHSIFSREIKTNRWLWYAVLVSVVLVLVVTEFPAANQLFDTAPLSFLEWLMVVALSASVVVVEEFRKIVRKFVVK